MTSAIKELDTVAALVDLRSIEGEGVLRGQLGTVVERLPEEHFLVEFADRCGCTYATAEMASNQLLTIRDEPAVTGR